MCDSNIRKSLIAGYIPFHFIHTSEHDPIVITNLSEIQLNIENRRVYEKTPKKHIQRTNETERNEKKKKFCNKFDIKWQFRFTFFFVSRSTLASFVNMCVLAHFISIRFCFCVSLPTLCSSLLRVRSLLPNSSSFVDF